MLLKYNVLFDQKYTGITQKLWFNEDRSGGSIVSPQTEVCLCTPSLGSIEELDSFSTEDAEKTDTEI